MSIGTNINNPTLTHWFLKKSIFIVIFKKIITYNILCRARMYSSVMRTVQGKERPRDP